MFGSLGVPELLLIFVVILIVFGPRRIPEIGRTLGKALGEFRKATDDLKNSIEREVRLEELKSIAPTTMAAFNTPETSVARGAAAVTPPVGGVDDSDALAPSPSDKAESPGETVAEGSADSDAPAAPAQALGAPSPENALPAPVELSATRRPGDSETASPEATASPDPAIVSPEER